MAPCVIFCCCSLFASSYLGYSEWLFELLLSSYHVEAVWPVSFDLWHQQYIFTQRTSAHGRVSLFWTCLCKHSKLWGKIPVDQQFLKKLRPACLASRTTQWSVSFKSHFFPNLILFLLEFQQVALTRSKCLNASCCHEIDYIVASTSSWKGVPPKMTGECKLWSKVQWQKKGIHMIGCIILSLISNLRKILNGWHMT